MAHKGSVPMFAIVIDVEKALFHCAKCIIRSGLWEHDGVEGVPNFGAILKDHADLDQSADEVQQAIDESKLANLY
jgi:hypothetical protein